MRAALPPLIVAAAPAAAGLAMASLLGPSWPGAIAAMVGGMTAGAVAMVERRRVVPEPPPVPDEKRNTLAPAALLAAIDEPLLLVERGRVVLANPTALDLLGDHILGEDARLAIRHPGAAARLADPGEGSVVELVGLGARDRVWEMSVRTVDAGLQLIHLADRSARRAAETMRVDFVANASHELRTPLATIIGFIETLEDSGEDPKVRKRFLAIMAGEARRMQRLVDDLMSLSRIEADKHRVPSESLDLAALAEEAVAVFRETRQDTTRRVKISDDAALRQIAGDRGQILQLLHNLIGNALKYGRPDGAVRINLEDAGDAVRLVVADEGDGIPPEHLPRLTERFYRVDPSRSRGVGGTGLGLSIVKHIVERHRGRLDIASVLGSGTTVTVLLPPVAVIVT